MGTTKEKYILKLFIKFLKRYGTYDAYLQFLLKDKGSFKRACKYISYTIRTTPRTLIIDAFVWSDCGDKSINWSTLHWRWVDTLFYYKF